MGKDLADFAVDYAIKNGADYAEARYEKVHGDSFLLKNSILEASGFDLSEGIGLRLILNNALGFVSINSLIKPKIKDSIDRGIKITKASSRLNKEIKISREDIKNAKYAVLQKQKLSSVSPETKLNELLELDKSLKHISNRYFSFSSYTKEKYFINSEGIKITSIIPKINLFYFLTFVDKGKSIQRYWQYGNSGGWEFFEKWNLHKNIADDFDALKRNLRNAKKPPKGNLDVVVYPEVTGIMVHESVGHPCEADRIFGREAAQAGESFIEKEMLGQKVGSNSVTIIDDPTLKNSYGFYAYDDEGVMAKKRILIKQGKFNEFLHNRETAKEMDITSNASMRASSYDVEPLIRMANTYLAPGDYNDEELTEDIKLGVLIKNFTEWNIDDLRLNQKYVGNEAYLIKNGKVLHPVKQPAIEITTPRLWSSVDAVSKRIEMHAASCGKGEPQQSMPVFHGGPAMRIRNISVK